MARIAWNKGLAGTYRLWPNGRTFTQEHLLKLSLSHKGKKLSEETKKKLSKCRKEEWLNGIRKGGWHHTLETRGEMSIEHKKFRHTEESKRKLSESHKGEKHYRWIKDRELAKRNWRNDGEYKKWVLAVKKRDKGCKLSSDLCSGYLIVHHIERWSERPDLRYDINNGITLCQFHHPRKMREERELKPMLLAAIPQIA